MTNSKVAKPEKKDRRCEICHLALKGHCLRKFHSVCRLKRDSQEADTHRLNGGAPKRMWLAMARFCKPDMVCKERPVTLAYQLAGHKHKGNRE